MYQLLIFDGKAQSKIEMYLETSYQKLQPLFNS